LLNVGPTAQVYVRDRIKKLRFFNVIELI
jgi:hypothetical protein